MEARPGKILLGRWSQDELDGLIRDASGIGDAGTRIDFLSERFLNTPYREHTLIGSERMPEEFVINLEGVDCFTFIEYIETMRLSDSFAEFTGNLRQIRYRGGEVHFRARNHFLSDWIEFNGDIVRDVTEEVGAMESETIARMLNERDDGSFFVPGIAPRQRDVHFIPSRRLGGAVVGRLKTGDYIGIYSPLAGLDVSHTGIFIRAGSALHFRHASSAVGVMKVVDDDFGSYVSDTPGIMVLRPREPASS